jgi:hypothetical protein
VRGSNVIRDLVQDEPSMYERYCHRQCRTPLLYTLDPPMIRISIVRSPTADS